MAEPTILFLIGLLVIIGKCNNYGIDQDKYPHLKNIRVRRDAPYSAHNKEENSATEPILPETISIKSILKGDYSKIKRNKRGITIDGPNGYISVNAGDGLNSININSGNGINGIMVQNGYNSISVNTGYGISVNSYGRINGNNAVNVLNGGQIYRPNANTNFNVYNNNGRVYYGLTANDLVNVNTNGVRGMYNPYNTNDVNIFSYGTGDTRVYYNGVRVDTQTNNPNQGYNEITNSGAYHVNVNAENAAADGYNTLPNRYNPGDRHNREVNSYKRNFNGYISKDYFSQANNKVETTTKINAANIVSNIGCPQFLRQIKLFGTKICVGDEEDIY